MMMKAVRKLSSNPHMDAEQTFFSLACVVVPRPYDPQERVDWMKDRVCATSLMKWEDLQRYIVFCVHARDQGRTPARMRKSRFEGVEHLRQQIRWNLLPPPPADGTDTLTTSNLHAPEEEEEEQEADEVEEVREAAEAENAEVTEEARQQLGALLDDSDNDDDTPQNKICDEMFDAVAKVQANLDAVLDLAKAKARDDAHLARLQHRLARYVCQHCGAEPCEAERVHCPAGHAACKDCVFAAFQREANVGVLPDDVVHIKCVCQGCDKPIDGAVALKVVPCAKLPLLYQTVIDEHDAHLLCPLSCALFEDPVMTSDGFTWEREQIERWFVECSKETPVRLTNPVTCLPIATNTLVPNRTVRSLANDARKRKRHSD